MGEIAVHHLQDPTGITIVTNANALTLTTKQLLPPPRPLQLPPPQQQPPLPPLPPLRPLPHLLQQLQLLAVVLFRVGKEITGVMTGTIMQDVIGMEVPAANHMEELIGILFVTIVNAWTPNLVSIVLT